MSDVVHVVTEAPPVVDRVEIPSAVGPRGLRGFPVELATSATHVQWRVADGLDGAWSDLVPLEDLVGATGPAPELRTDSGWIQWREPGGAWQNLADLSTLVGPKGDAATVAVGTTTTLDEGADATVENVGTSGAAVLNFGIPRGNTGNTGASAFQAAQAGGFVGTEAEWLASLEGADGADGATWHAGSGAPGAGLGTAGDLYLDTDTGDVYQRAAAWALVGNIRGTAGVNGTGWTGATYDPETGVVTFTSAHGLGFATGDLRGTNGIGVPDPTSAPANKVPVTDGAGGYVLGDAPEGGGAGINPSGEWSSFAAYSEGDTVTVGNRTYVAAVDVGLGVDPTDAGAMDVLTTLGPGTTSLSYSNRYAIGIRFTPTETVTIRGFGLVTTSLPLSAARIGVNGDDSIGYDEITDIATMTVEPTVNPNEYRFKADTPIVLSAGVEYLIGFRVSAASGVWRTGTMSDPAGKFTAIEGMYGNTGTSWSAAATAHGLPVTFYEPADPWEHLAGLPAVTDLTAPDDSTLPTAQAVVDYVGGLTVDPSALPDGKMMQVSGGVWVAVDAPTGGGGSSDPYPDVFMMMGA